MYTASNPYQEINRLHEKLQQTWTTTDDVAGLNSEVFSCPLSNDDLDSAFVNVHVEPKEQWIPFTSSSDSHSLTSTQAAVSDTNFKAFEGTGNAAYTHADTSNQCSNILSDYALLLDSSNRLDRPEMTKCSTGESGERARVEGQLEGGASMLTISDSMQSTHDPDWQHTGESGDSFQGEEERVTDDDSEEENLLSAESTSPRLPKPDSCREVCHLNEC